MINRVAALMPNIIKKRRKVENPESEGVMWEEYHDYSFPGDEADKPTSKLAAMAHEWKRKMEANSNWWN